MAFKTFKKVFLSISNDVPKTLEDMVEVLRNLVRTVNILQNNVEASFDPLNAKTQNDSQILTNVVLKASNINVINHQLSRTLSGWNIVRKRASAEIWDAQDTNKQANLTLLLHTNMDVTIDLEVF